MLGWGAFRDKDTRWQQSSVTRHQTTAAGGRVGGGGHIELIRACQECVVVHKWYDVTSASSCFRRRSEESNTRMSKVKSSSELVLFKQDKESARGQQT